MQRRCCTALYFCGMKRPILLIACSVAVLAAAAQASGRTATGENASDTRVRIEPAKPAPGSLVRVSLDDAAAPGLVTSIVGTMGGEPLHFRRDSTGVPSALAPVPVDVADSLVAHVVISLASGAVDTLMGVVRVPPEPPVENTRTSASKLKVADRFTARPDPAVTARVARENQRARAVGRGAHKTPQLWTEPFERPRESRITSSFGSGRVFNGKLLSRHLGVDFSGKPGAPVHAANRGVVRLVDRFYLAGNVIYIDHGAGVVTGYFHLSEQDVAAGDTVSRGQVIGRVGATGRVTGPHLHWNARYGAVTVNPLDLVKLTESR